ncbi:thermonuclease family protein [Anaeromyxobacter sp. Red801]|uniref:thermonuclease family protein n=1 Tax=Anaeromyxobacter sp. Red801 TaxID=3411632 RepID=UPI003BA1B9C6
MIPPRRPLLALCCLALALAAPSDARARRGRSARAAEGRVVLDGEAAAVRWTDGDTFRLVSGPRAGQRARLAGVNTLETYGPVHRWGGWRPEALLAVARAAGPRAAAGTWDCRSVRGRGGRDRYGRLLVECPELSRTLVREGLATVFAMDGPADPALLAAQREAQRAGAGMWAEGVPDVIVSSAHSEGEAGLGRRGAYDRLVDARTGAATARPHARTYRACEEVCAGEGRGRSCLVYVPYERRFRDRPPCLVRR